MLIALGMSCSSGKKAFEHGNYYQAVIQSVNRLRNAPNNKKAAETLRTAYPSAVKSLDLQAKNRVASNDPYKWKSVLQSYEQINHMYEEILHSPAASNIVTNPKSYYSELETARSNAAQESYDHGEIEMAKKTRESAKQAYFHYMDVDKFVPGYKDVTEKIRESKFMATLKVVVEQIPVPNRYALSGDFFQAKVEEYLHSEMPANEFVRFYNPAEAQTENVEYPDQILRLEFDDFSVGDTYLKESTVEHSKDSVVVGQVTLPDGSKMDAYNTVKVRMTTYTKAVTSEGLLSFHVVDAFNNAILTTEKFPGKFEWVSEWATYNGDERALTKKQLDLCKQKEIPPPGPQDMFIEFTRPIYGQLTAKIRSFYGRY